MKHFLSNKRNTDINPAPASDEIDDLPRRSSNKGFFLSALCIVLVAAMIISSLPSSAGEDSRVNTRVISGMPEKKVITTVLSGAGTLTDREADPVTIPAAVAVDVYHVRNGQAVAEGDVLASVDKVSVAAAVSELQDVITELDKDLRSQSDKKPAGTIKATAAGRVKKIYAAAGDDVAQTMYDYGALMLLSLDGLMAAEFPTDADITIGDSVNVIFPDGHTERGRIAAYSDGIATVTVSDEHANYGNSVSVETLDEAPLGQGTLFIHSELKVGGYYGKIAAVSVAEGQQVTIGRQLFSLKDTGHTPEYTALLQRRYELEGQMEQLSKLSASGYILAQANGVVSGIPEGAKYETPELTAKNTAVSPKDSTVRISLLSAAMDPIQLSATVVNVNGNVLTISVDADQVAAFWNDFVGSTVSFSYDDAVYLSDGSTCTLADLQPEDKLRITFEANILGEPSGVSRIERISAGSPDGDGGDTPNPGDDDNPGRPNPGGSQGGLGGLGGFSGWSGLFGSLGGNRGQASQSSQTPAYEKYDTSTTDVLTIIPQEDMTVCIQIDELDVLSLRVGLDAQVTLDALKGKEFSGRITRIATIGTNSGGNTKYTVEVTLPKSPEMLDGMNASVKVVTAASDAVPTIPVAALEEKGGRTYVYTAYSQKDDLLSGLTEVQTGVSDGNLVEILSGLDENGTYYYRYADSIEYDFLR